MTDPDQIQPDMCVLDEVAGDPAPADAAARATRLLYLITLGAFAALLALRLFGPLA